MNYLKSGKSTEATYMYIFIGVYMSDSAFELKCLDLYINDYLIGVIIDIGSITSDKKKGACNH